ALGACDLEHLSDLLGPGARLADQAHLPEPHGAALRARADERVAVADEHGARAHQGRRDVLDRHRAGLEVLEDLLHPAARTGDGGTAGIVAAAPSRPTASTVSTTKAVTSIMSASMRSRFSRHRSRACGSARIDSAFASARSCRLASENVYVR